MNHGFLITPPQGSDSLWSSVILSRHRSHVSSNKLIISKTDGFCVFWDSKGDVLVYFMSRNTTINSDSYCATLERLRRDIQNSWGGKNSRGIVLLHDNARPHTARKTKVLPCEQFRWDIFEHPPYSQDLASSDFFLFPKMKEHLSDKLFANDEDLKNAAVTRLYNHAATWYKDGITKLQPRYDKCLNVKGDYVE